jgi:hypothetical protein
MALITAWVARHDDAVDSATFRPRCGTRCTQTWNWSLGAPQVPAADKALGRHLAHDPDATTLPEGDKRAVSGRSGSSSSLLASPCWIRYSRTAVPPHPGRTSAFHPFAIVDQVDAATRRPAPELGTAPDPREQNGRWAPALHRPDPVHRSTETRQGAPALTASRAGRRNIRDVEDNVRGGILDAGTRSLRSGVHSWRRLPTLPWPPHASSRPPAVRVAYRDYCPICCGGPL